MTSANKTLLEEIKQTKPFANVGEEAYVNLLRTADELQSGLAAMLKPYGVSPTQYNVLRILRGAGNAGLPCGEVGNRMVTRDPDITRLLDRMEKAGWIERARDTRDRRIVTTRITKSGLALLKKSDADVEGFSRRALNQLGDARLRTLIEILDEMRAGAKKPE